VVEVKWTPSSPSSPHWYDRAAFTALVYSHIRHTHNDHPDKPIGEFIREFDGLTSTAKAKPESTDGLRFGCPDYL